MTIIRYRKDIDGMRAFAVLAVFIYHLYPSLLKGGFIGVDVFFVISGYLITRILLREHQSHNFSFTNFYIRRIKRILPVLFVVIFVSTFVAVIALDIEAFRDFTRAGRYASAQISNFYFAKELNYFSANNDLQPLLHTWSLGVEEQFYLLWPLLIFFCFRLRNNIQKALLGLFVALFISSFLLSAFLSVSDHKQSFYMVYSRGWEFAIGGIIALDIIPPIKKRALNQFISLFAFIALMGSFVFLSSKQNLFLGGYLIPCIASALLIHTAKEEGQTWISQILSLKIFVFIGLISYSLYLWHWPLISFYKNITYANDISLIAAMIIIILAFLLAYLSYHFVEKPCRKIEIKNAIVFIIAFAVMISFAVSMKLLQKQYDASWRIGDIEFSAEINVPECIDKKREGFIYNENSCDKPSSSKALLVGDSHAIHYYESARQWSTKNAYSFSYLQDNSCPLLLGYEAHQNDKECSFAQSVLQSRFLKDKNLKLVFIAVRYDKYYHDDKGFPKAINYTIQQFKRHGKEVILLGQVPLLKQNPNKYLSETILKRITKPASIQTYLDSLENNFASEIVQKKRYNQTLAFIEKISIKHNIPLFEAQNIITSAIYENKILYADFNHLSRQGTEYIKPYVAEFLDEYMKKEK